MSLTTKFVYITWFGKDVSFVKRGKYGVVSGSVEKFFSVRLYIFILYSIYKYNTVTNVACIVKSFCVLNKRMPFRVHSFHGNNARVLQSCM